MRVTMRKMEVIRVAESRGINKVDYEENWYLRFAAKKNMKLILRDRNIFSNNNCKFTSLLLYAGSQRIVE